VDAIAAQPTQANPTDDKNRLVGVMVPTVDELSRPSPRQSPLK
jgi:hypothetical protein